MPVRPKDGDIVVSAPAAGSGSYTVHQEPGVVQVKAPRREEAMGLAQKFAMQQVVNLWYHDGRTCVLIERYRRYDPPTA